MSRRCWIGLAMVAFVGALVSAARLNAQGSGSTRSAPAQPAQPRRAQTPEEFNRQLWEHLVNPKSPYNKWPTVPGKPGWQKGEDPHGPATRLYVNQAAAKSLQDLPVRSIFVLENYADDQKQRTSIDVMYRVKDYDPANGNWYWLRFAEDGSVKKDEKGKLMSGKVQSCSQCHTKAAGKDLVYSNDELEQDNASEGEK